VLIFNYSFLFFHRIIKRLETSHPPQLVEGILKRICLSRQGLSQREMLAMMQLEKVSCHLSPFEMISGH